MPEAKVNYDESCVVAFKILLTKKNLFKSRKFTTRKNKVALFSLDQNNNSFLALFNYSYNSWYYK